MRTSLINQTLPSFDELMELARSNPDAFSQLKHDMCEEMILSASEEMQGRLWAQQSHIDRIVNNCKNPNHINMVLMRELVSQITKFQDVLDGGVIESGKQPLADVILLDEWR
jgi:hypothetical protein